MDEYQAYNAVIEHLRKASEAARTLGTIRQDQPWLHVADGIRKMSEQIADIAMAKGGWVQ